jgi:hypothetical protein
MRAARPQPRLAAAKRRAWADEEECLSSLVLSLSRPSLGQAVCARAGFQASSVLAPVPTRARAIRPWDVGKQRHFLLAVSRCAASLGQESRMARSRPHACCPASLPRQRHAGDVPPPLNVMAA